LIALIIDAHRSAAARHINVIESRDKFAGESHVTVLGSIKKTSLLQTHPRALRSCDAH